MIAGIELQVREARDKAFYDASILMQTYHWDQKTDVRITIIGRLIRLLVALQLSLRSLQNLEAAPDEEWSTLLLPAGENNERRPYLLVHELVTKTGFVSSLFAAMESSLRILVNDIDPIFYATNQLQTRRLIRFLLHERLSRQYSSEFKSIDFLRTLRNTLHSNGVFYPAGGGSAEFTFRGSTYEFEPQQRVEFASWQLVLDLADEMCQISFRLVRDPVISSKPAILDLWSTEI